MKKTKTVELIQYKTKTKPEDELPDKVGADLPPASNIPPGFLNAEQKRAYNYYAALLIEQDLFTDLDTWHLAAFCKKLTKWKMLSKIIDRYDVDPEDFRNLDNYKKINIEESRTFKELRELANDLGLSISSRSKLKTDDKPEEKINKFAGFIE